MIRVYLIAPGRVIVAYRPSLLAFVVGFRSYERHAQMLPAPGGHLEWRWSETLVDVGRRVRKAIDLHLRTMIAEAFAELKLEIERNAAELVNRVMREQRERSDLN